MEIGDLVEPWSPEGKERYVFLGDEIPWSHTFGMVGDSHPFYYGTVGIFLGEKAMGHDSLYGKSAPDRVFYKVLTSDGRMGWLHESWVRKVEKC